MTRSFGGNMYCNKCGKFLVGQENFCSKCGSKVEESLAQENNKNQETKEEIDKEVQSLNIGDDIVWNVEEFPSNVPKKTEDTEFEWRSEDMFLHKEIRREEVAFIDEGVESQESQINQAQDIEVPNIFQTTATNGQGQQTFSDISNEEKDYVVEIEQPNKGNVEIEVDKEEVVKVERVNVGKLEAITSILKKDKIEDREESEAGIDNLNVENIETKQNMDITGDKEKSLIDEIEPQVSSVLENPNLSEGKRQIDKFYTFNRKKEAFQDLLDKEYERIERKCEPGGFEEDITGFMDVEMGTDVEGTTQLEEMIRARELFFDDPFAKPEDIDVMLDEKAEKPEEDSLSEEGIPAEELEKDEDTNLVFEATKEESLAEALIDNKAEESTDEDACYAKSEEDEEHQEAAIIIDPIEKKENDDTESLAKEFFDDVNEEEKKKDRGFKVAIWVLSIAIVILTSLITIRIVMPNTYLSKSMDNIASKVISFLSWGDNDKYKENFDGELVEDKSGLIQLQLDKNYKNNIGTIKYNADIKYDPQVKYDFATLEEAKDIQSNFWYEDNKGQKYYYNKELIGTIIAFESKKTAYINDGDNSILDIIEKDSNVYDEVIKDGEGDKEDFEILEIGDIKVAKNAYYIWVIETKNGVSVRKVYEIKQQNKKLLVTASINI